MTGSSVRPRSTSPSPWPHRSSSSATARRSPGTGGAARRARSAPPTGQGRAEAVVDAVTEREVAGAVATDVEHVGWGYGGGVTVGRGQADDDLGARRDGDPAELDRRHGVAERRVRHGRVEAKQLLDGSGQPRRVGAQLGELARIAEQGDHTVADQARRRVVAGDDQLKDRGEQLPGVEPLVPVAGADQRADQVVAGRARASPRRALRASPPRRRTPAWPRRTAPASTSARAAR